LPCRLVALLQPSDSCTTLRKCESAISFHFKFSAAVGFLRSVETSPEQSQTRVAVHSHRRLATRWSAATPLLRTASPGRYHVRPSAASSDRRKRLASTGRIAARGATRALPQKRRTRLSPARARKRPRRSGFWAMHVEATTWCGLGAQVYVKANHRSVHSLERRRPSRSRRGANRLAGASSSERTPCVKR
jgi:hypothetical protein